MNFRVPASLIAAADAAEKPLTDSAGKTMLSLPDHFLGDLVSAFSFGLLAILLVVLGYKVFDWLTPRCDFESEINKGNVAAALTVAAVILGICYIVAHVLSGILGS
jgi:putative membrane protein